MGNRCLFCRNIKSQSGFTIISLVVYVIGFLTITVVIGMITTFFYKNINTLEAGINTSSEYNKFNLYILNEVKERGNTISDFGDYYITFRRNNGSGDFKTFVLIDNILYYNKIALCENIEDFKIEVKNEGKETIRVLIQIGNHVYTTEYVLGG